MDTLKIICVMLCTLIGVANRPVGLRAAPPAGSHSLFAQSASRLLAREFNDPGISYLLLDVNTGAVLASRWENMDAAIPVGSLVKPFTALAYGSTHAYRYPEHVCRPGQCWLPRGHGRQDLVSATANSCNAYFRALARQVTAEELGATAREFGLNSPGSGTTAAFIGLGSSWRVAPLALARSYAELVHRRTQPGIAEIMQGMHRSAAAGTGGEVGRRLSRSAALVKTGTAECSHRPRASADGFTLALFPGDDPRILLLVRVHGTTGAHAAVTAGEILHALEEQPSVAD